MVGSLALCLLSDDRPPVPERRIPYLCVVPASIRERNTDLREAGSEEVGL